ncbi:LamG-like jellyroll fold domain-containing protein [Mangrovimonas aestuarii]|uniref:LamG-like jellyroll fold domain-containing protein n=1 Tax=Mangrovimonas aestuarii TaxID=3018443 RepID=UPI002378600B|nr:LamG-like jellyroll fold domain-containing protein [Mangrovimonas aestuarii]
MKKQLLSLKTLFYALALTGVTATAQNGLDFDGIDDYVQTTCPGVANNGARTVEAWIKTTKNSNPSEGGSQSVIVDWGSTSSNGKRFTFNVLWSNAIRLEIAGSGLSGTIAVNDGNWHHVAVTFDPSGNTMSLYVDGVLDTAGIMSSVNSGITTNVRIGKRIDNASPFQGSIDEVRIWDVARTQAEIQADMNNELCDNTPNLIGYYKLNEGTADGDNTGLTTAFDTVNSNDGTLSGFDLTTGSTSNWVAGASITTTPIIDNTVSNDNSTLTANQTGATYQWVDFANEPILGETNQTFTPTADGNYAVEITMGGCTVVSETINFTTGSLSINDNLFANSIRLYPNPTNNNINVNLGDTYTTVNAKLLSVNGRVIANKTFNNTSELNMGINHAAGIYFLNIITGTGKSAVLKVIKR